MTRLNTIATIATLLMWFTASATAEIRWEAGTSIARVDATMHHPAHTNLGYVRHGDAAHSHDLDGDTPTTLMGRFSATLPAAPFLAVEIDATFGVEKPFPADAAFNALSEIPDRYRSNPLDWPEYAALYGDSPFPARCYGHEEAAQPSCSAGRVRLAAFLALQWPIADNVTAIARAGYGRTANDHGGGVIPGQSGSIQGVGLLVERGRMRYRVDIQTERGSHDSNWGGAHIDRTELTFTIGRSFAGFGGE